jgi:carboxyl-terminal processing protease
MLTLALALPLVLIQDDFARLWARCEQTIRNTYYAREEKKQRMEELLTRFKPLAESAKSRQEFDQVMDQMTKEFGDSHFEFYTQEEQGYYALDGFRGSGADKMPHIGAWFKKAEEGYIVQMVLDGMPAAKAGLRKGDIIIAVNEEPFTPISSLRPLVGSQATLKFKRNQTLHSAQVEVKEQRAFEMFLEATKNSVKIIEREGKRIGYVHLWTMATTDFRQTLKSLLEDTFKDVDGLILDLRDGFGGRPDGYLSLFGVPEYQASYQNRMLTWRAREMKEETPKTGFQAPLVLITNGGTRSAKEVFAFMVKETKRGTLVGLRTSGHVLGTSPLRIVEWAYLEIPMVKVQVGNKLLEGVGVEPDILVTEEMDAEGKDLCLEASLQYLINLGTKKPALAGSFR